VCREGAKKYSSIGETRMHTIFILIAGGIWAIGLLGTIIFVLLSIIAFVRKRKNALSMYMGAGVLSFVVVIVGIVLIEVGGTSLERSEKRSEAAENERENQRIIKNIQRNDQLQEEAHQKSLKEQEKAMEKTGEELSELNTHVLEANEEQGVYDAVISYENLMIEAINYGDFRMVEPYLLPNSHLTMSQEIVIDSLYANGIIASMGVFNIESIRKVAEDIFEAEAYLELHMVDGVDEEDDVARWVYTVQNVHGQYLLSDVKKANNQ